MKEKVKQNYIEKLLSGEILLWGNDYYLEDTLAFLENLEKDKGITISGKDKLKYSKDSNEYSLSKVSDKEYMLDKVFDNEDRLEVVSQSGILESRSIDDYDTSYPLNQAVWNSTVIYMDTEGDIKRESITELDVLKNIDKMVKEGSILILEIFEIRFHGDVARNYFNRAYINEKDTFAITFRQNLIPTLTMETLTLVKDEDGTEKFTLAPLHGVDEQLFTYSQIRDLPISTGYLSLHKVSSYNTTLHLKRVINNAGKSKK